MALLRKSWKLPQSYFRFCSYNLTLTPIHQIECRSDGYRATGEDPQFSIASERRCLPAGWAVVSYDGCGKGCMLQLRFYVDRGDGYSEDAAVNLGYHSDGHSEELVRFPDRVVAMRLDPMSWDGLFELRNLRIREIGKFGVLIYLIRYHVSNRIRRADSLSEFVRHLVSALSRYGVAGWKDRLVDLYERDQRSPERVHSSPWFSYYRLGADQLHELAERSWSKHAPTFSIIMPIYNPSAIWLGEAIESVLSQIYAHWELICIDDGSSSSHVAVVLKEFADRDTRIIVLSNERNTGVSAATNRAFRRASGDYVCFMDHDDYLEPHALWRFADAVVSDNPDFIYSDEVITAADDLDHVLHVSARPAFSYDYYLSHPYFVHLIAIRYGLMKKLGGLDERLDITHDVDFNLRAFEHAETITHVPDILYRWREHSGSTGHTLTHRVMDTSRGVLSRHLSRLGFDADVGAGPRFNVHDIRFFPVSQEGVAVVIPTRNRGDLLRTCVESIQATTEKGDLDLIIIDHESDDPDTRAYLCELEIEHRVIRYEGKFNFSKMNNYAIENLATEYDYYLFMNNDIEALESGWFEKMLDRAKRADVGVVGATLVFPDGTVQHSGVTVGMYGCAEHAFKSVDFHHDGKRFSGRDCSLVATRDYSAVTAACMMMRSDLFHEVGGFDEALPVGFNDTDLCLRVLNRGYKILNCAGAVLLHHESATRGKAMGDPHPVDSALFKRRYQHMIEAGDPFYNPMLSTEDPRWELRNRARCPLRTRSRTVRGFLPGVRRKRRDCRAVWNATTGGGR